MTIKNYKPNKITDNKGINYDVFPDFDQDEVIIVLKSKKGLDGIIKIELLDNKINSTLRTIKKEELIIDTEIQFNVEKINLKCIAGIFKGNKFDLLDGRLHIKDYNANNEIDVQFNEFINIDSNVIDILSINNVSIELVKQKGNEDLSLEFHQGKDVQFIYNFNKGKVEVKKN